jgi:hypothetical protein
MDSPKHKIERKINHHQLAIDVGVGDGEIGPIGGAVSSGDPRECCKNVVRYDKVAAIKTSERGCPQPLKGLECFRDPFEGRAGFAC